MRFDGGSRLLACGRALALTLAVLAAPGCLVVSLHPSYDADSLGWDPALLGAWENAEDRASLQIERADWKSYRIRYVYPIETGELTGYLTAVGDDRFLDVMPARGDDRGSFLVPVHALLRVRLTDDRLELTPLSYDWFFDHARYGRKIPGLDVTLDQKENALIVSPTSALRNWVRRSGRNRTDVWRAGGFCPEAGRGDSLTFRGEARMRTVVRLALIALLVPVPLSAQNRSEDEYTRYELLAPDTASFKIIYDVTAVSAGAKFFFNPIRRGSVASDESVIDLMTGAPLKFTEVSGAEARESGLTSADLEGRYIRVELARPVPDGGEARIRIIKTYKDPKSYFRDGSFIVFDRPLGIRRNSVILPAGFELVSCNVPSQVIEEADGRVGISFMNIYPGQAPLVLRARPVTAANQQAAQGGSQTKPAQAMVDPPAQEPPMDRIRVSERAFQDREIVYFLKQPETGAFSLYHDYTETREGTDKYLNIVRRGSTVSDPSARVLDTGDKLKVETLKGDAITKAGIDIGEAVRPDSEVVVIRFPPVAKGQSVRLRIEETYTDPARYARINGELMWRRSFGRPRNDVVLPEGWYLTTSSIPATVSQMEDGRIRLSFWNHRPDNVDVFIKARRRTGA